MNKELMKGAASFISRSDKGEKISVAECETYLNSIPSFTDKHTMKDTVDFLEFLGNPDQNMKIIHVAGTNGKGSVCSYLSSILMKAGYSVGMFTSPHLVKVNERFCIDGKMISDGVFTEVFVETLKRVVEYDHKDYFPTYFEFLFFVSMILYDVYPVDYLILETGLGGRLDATNSVSNPLLTVITEIGYDHMQYLGESIAEIAGEKAGIIKPWVPVVFFDKQKESTEVIKQKALELDSRAIVVERKNIQNVSTVQEDEGNKYIAFSYISLYDKYVDLKLNTEARYQAENAALAVTAAEILKNEGADISELDIREGLISAKWEARMEEIRPGIYVDGAHNVDGIEAFIDSAANIPSSGRKLLMFGIVGDKQYKEIIDKLLVCGEFDSIFVAVLETNRSVSVSDLKSAFEECKEEHGIIGLPIKYYSNVRDAITDIITVRKSGDTVFAAGSLYLAGQIKSML
ncbi:bifunctional folylpolyglutamate synthase/dihydrofolate synthase [Butyrivibrio sp. XB500-5]|uniref:bifunctional folylpolyglutamate synthase/dihydrofolate synthase n=1 Tax=Butyrivibrio sp. XB500-5 TaxID=2364880 RepID=UPI000EA983B6|nr:folylpolyglutamate synthase/dihydrofolate synthase family protein [Butyrivibrio sp. XB500-5]RKM63245.1 bifunctional folylpolyglutamate synthase/dihydrofolate synthase [Butyrivibrio sp. XB500-5]